MADDFETFVRTEANALLRFSYQLTGDAERARDLVQDVLVTLLRNWPQVNRATNRTAYVRRSLVNAHLAECRKSDRRAAIWARWIAGLADTTSSPSEHYDDRDAIWSALATVTARQRATLVLRYYEDRSDDEIAAILRCSRSTVRSLAARGLARMQNQLQPHESTAVAEETR